MKKILSMLLVFIMLLGISINGQAAPATPTQLPPGEGSAVSAVINGTTIHATSYPDQARGVAQLVNAERQAAGLPELGWIDDLSDPAVLRGIECIVSFSHTRPDGTDCLTVHSKANGENLAMGDTTYNNVMAGWMNSPPHKANILNANYRSIAVACIVSQSGDFYWVQLFSVSQGTAIPNPDPGPDPTPATRYTVTFHSNGGSAVASQTVEAGKLVTRPANPTRTSHTFQGWYKDPELTTMWNFTTDTVDANTALYAKWTYNNSGNSGNSGGSGGGSSSGGSSRSDKDDTSTTGTTGSTTKATDNPSGNVNSDGSVSSSAIKSEIEKAVASATGSKVTVRTRNAQTLSSSTIRTMAKAASGKTVTLYADTLSADRKTVQGRLYVEPAKLTGSAGNLKLGVYTESAKTARTRARFEKWFSNPVAVVHLEQTGSYGARLQIAARVDLSKLDGDALVFYSYDKSKNQYTMIQNPAYFVDSNGYLHFYTDKAGDIVITDATFVKK